MATDAPQGVEHTVKIRRCAAVVKGGRRFSFAAMVVVGDGRGRVGWGYGKANEVPPSVEKAKKQASREQMEVRIVDDTIPHTVQGKYGAGGKSASRWKLVWASLSRVVHLAGFSGFGERA